MSTNYVPHVMVVGVLVLIFCVIYFEEYGEDMVMTAKIITELY
jgi:hypothetical protein